MDREQIEEGLGDQWVFTTSVVTLSEEKGRVCIAQGQLCTRSDRQ